MFCVAHVNTERGWRGGEQQVYSLIEGLSRRGHKNIAFVRRGEALAERLHNLDCHIEEINPSFEYDPFSAGYMAIRLRHLGVQILHAHTAHGVALAALATLRNKTPFVLTRRVDFPVASNLLSWWKYNRAAKIISISDAVSTVLKNSGIAAEKIVKVPSGVDFRRYEGVVPFSKTEMAVPNSAVVIGQVAALAPHKDQRTFLEAISLLRDKNIPIRAFLVGDGPLEAELKKRSASLRLGSIVHFAGFQAEPLRWLKSFDIFCLSSREEGLGTSLIDAMALGVPIVATKAGGIPEIVEDGVTGQLVAPQNPVALAAVLERAIAQRGRAMEMAVRAKERAPKFDVSHTVESTEAVYRSVVGQG